MFRFPRSKKLVLHCSHTKDVGCSACRCRFSSSSDPNSLGQFRHLMRLRFGALLGLAPDVRGGREGPGGESWFSNSSMRSRRNSPFLSPRLPGALEFPISMGGTHVGQAPFSRSSCRWALPKTHRRHGYIPLRTQAVKRAGRRINVNCRDSGPNSEE